MRVLGFCSTLVIWIILHVVACADRAVLINELTTIPCSLLTNTPPLTLGEDVFAAANISGSSVQEIMITIWIFPLQFLLYTNDIFSIYTASPLAKVVSLKFNRLTLRTQGTLKGSVSGDVIFINNQWNYIRILVKLNPSNGGQDELVV